jgi:UDP-N-acetylglucosamine:LPS N-acetylglucosamine transferase
MDRAARPRRILAIASGGGHWVQLQRLTPAFEGCDVAFASVYADYADDLGGARFYKFTDVSRANLRQLLIIVSQFIGIMLRERPDVVITTGSFPGLIGLTVARLTTRAKTIWIDSIANCEQLSSSGRQARRVAHQWLTQWPELAQPGGPQYWGAVL